MRLPRPIQNSLLLLTLVFVAPKVCAQFAPADNFFNSGAQFYISNNIPAALEQVESGLKIYPDDEKLKKLEELLKQKQQQQQQQNQQQKSQSQPQDQKQQNQSQSQKDQQSQQQKSNDQKKSADQQKSDEQKKSEADQKKDQPEKKEDQQKTSAGKKDDGKPEDQNGEGQPVKPGQMTPEEAKRLLDSQKGDEQTLKWKPKDKPEDQKKPVKDW
jgi:Ca-activated chloride channel family protein